MKIEEKKTQVNYQEKRQEEEEEDSNGK